MKYLVQIRESAEGIWLVFLNENEAGAVLEFAQLFEIDEALDIGKALIHVAETYTGAINA